MQIKLLNSLKEAMIEFDSYSLNKITIFRYLATIVAVVVIVIATIISPIIVLPLIVLEWIPIPNLKGKKWMKKLLYNHELSIDKGTYYLKADNRSGTPFQLTPNDTTLKNFIYNFINSYNYSYATFDHNDMFQCHPGRRRSLGDIYLICKHYFPECTMEEVLLILLNLTIDRRIGGSYCSTICKYVWTTPGTVIFDTKTEYKTGVKMIDILNHYGLKQRRS